MPKPAETAYEMISGMSPEQRPGEFVFASIKDLDQARQLAERAIATFRESEGMSLILPISVARSENLATDQPMVCITLNVYSSLQGVGLTAAVAAALGREGIACNMVAACHHDHVFVPAPSGEAAMRVLQDLQAAAGNAV